MKVLVAQSYLTLWEPCLKSRGSYLSHLLGQKNEAKLSVGQSHRKERIDSKTQAIMFQRSMLTSLHHVLVAPSCPTLCNSMDCSPPDFFIHEIFQTRILAWVAFSTPGDFPDPGIQAEFPVSPALAGRFFTTAPPGKAIVLPFKWPKHY